MRTSTMLLLVIIGLIYFHHSDAGVIHVPATHIIYYAPSQYIAVIEPEDDGSWHPPPPGVDDGSYIAELSEETQTNEEPTETPSTEEETSTDNSSTEESNAEESNAEEGNAEESNAEESSTGEAQEESSDGSQSDSDNNTESNQSNANDIGKEGDAVGSEETTTLTPTPVSSNIKWLALVTG